MENTYLDELLKTHSEVFFNRMLKVWKKRINLAIDKEFTRKMFLQKLANYSVWVMEDNESYKKIISIMAHNYKIGNPMNKSIQVVKNQKEAPYLKIDFIWDEETDEEIPFELSEIEEEYRNAELSNLHYQLFDWRTMKDKEFVYLFAEFKARRMLCKYIRDESINGKVYEIKESLKKTLRDNDPFENIEEQVELEALPKESIYIDENSKAGTTAQQTLIFHYMFEYMQVKNVDATTKTGFVQFLTGKSWDNIYKKIRTPIDFSKKSTRKDLLLIKDYFNHMNLPEIEKMIENDQEKTKKQVVF